ncbi:MAG: TetR family transcriptional regulator [Alphaproteobacteria bacterium]|nr:TetR family transcriptional regulator [Alphaproteobacteria bacterium]
MGRWAPDSRGRLARIAFALFAEKGFDETTSAEIAEAAGLTERTFFRHFADKRDVLFYAVPLAAGRLAERIAEAPAEVAPIEAVTEAIAAMCGDFQEEPELARQRHRVIASSPALQERELAKHEELARAIAAALVARGVDPTPARACGAVGIAAFRVAFPAWCAQRRVKGADLPETFRQTMAAFRAAVAEAR